MEKPTWRAGQLPPYEDTRSSDMSCPCVLLLFHVGLCHVCPEDIPSAPHSWQKHQGREPRQKHAARSTNQVGHGNVALWDCAETHRCPLGTRLGLSRNGKKGGLIAVVKLHLLIYARSVRAVLHSPYSLFHNHVCLVDASRVILGHHNDTMFAIASL